MKRAILLLCIFTVYSAFITQNVLPDLSKKEDLKLLGTGRIIESDNSVILYIQLYEIKEIGLVYIKDESLHDIPIESVQRIEFKRTPWGPLTIRFEQNKPVITRGIY